MDSLKWMRQGGSSDWAFKLDHLLPHEATLFLIRVISNFSLSHIKLKTFLPENEKASADAVSVCYAVSVLLGSFLFQFKNANILSLRTWKVPFLYKY